MKTQALIRSLERVVRDRTPIYVSVDNPHYDEKLVKAHTLLAILYSKDGNVAKARENVKEAETEFLHMCRAETQEPQYVLGGTEGFRKLREQQRKTQERLERYKGKLLEIASKVGYEPTSLLLVPTSSDSRNEAL